MGREDTYSYAAIADNLEIFTCAEYLSLPALVSSEHDSKMTTGEQIISTNANRAGKITK